MDTTELPIAGAWRFTPTQHGDERGTFLEWFQAAGLAEATGRTLDAAQANCSVSQAGALRGIHFADVPPGQAKYVTCVRGAVLDVVVDIRVGSPTFGAVEAVLLDDAAREAVFISEGLGHGFYALEDDATVIYLCSTAYNPAAEHGIDPLSIGFDWRRAAEDARARCATTLERAHTTRSDGSAQPQDAAPPGRSGTSVGQPILSPKDAAAPSLERARAEGLLPRFTGAIA